jgi:predicted Zn-dependent protease
VADEIGLIYAAKADYDPHAAIGFWERMEAQKKGAALPEFFSMHPSDSIRLRKINYLMPKAYEIYKNHK